MMLASRQYSYGVTSRNDQGTIESFLTKPVPAEGLEVGDVGTVVHVCADGKAFEVEFTTLDGKPPPSPLWRPPLFVRSLPTRSFSRTDARPPTYG
jgi:Domain of unknown function (DUF4926)